MALFGFSDISFNKGVTDRKGPLSSLTTSEFTTTTLRYPIDLGNYDKGHYMVFYVRQQKKSAFKTTTVADTSIDTPGGITTASIPNIGSVSSNLGSDLLNKVNSGLSQLNSATGGALSGVTGAISGAAGGIVGGINNLFGQTGSSLSGSGTTTSAIIDNSIKKISKEKSFIQTTELTTDAIALYMPDTLMFNQQQIYDQAAMGEQLVGQLAAAGVSAAKRFEETGGYGAGESLLKSALGIAADRVRRFLGDAGDVAFAASGFARNPLLELIYKSPQFRQFQFDFMFYPRDEKEAYEVQKIIERFRFHQAPEIVKDAQGFLVPPSEFDIRFYYGGAQNPNIPQIATCVLTTIDVNYAPNGWSAYEIPGENKPAIGRTGMPTAVQLTLQFQETTYLTKTDYKSGREQGIVKNIFDPSNIERDV